MAIGFNSIDGKQDAPLDITMALAPEAQRRAEAHERLLRVKSAIHEKRLARGTAETMELKGGAEAPLPKLADIEVLREQTRYTLEGNE